MSHCLRVTGGETQPRSTKSLIQFDPGFATVWLALSVNLMLGAAVQSHYLKDPGFVWQSNVLLAVVGLLLIAGIWGYSQRRFRTTLSALAVNRG